MLPSGPQWCSKEMVTEQPTLEKVHHYYRDPLHCIQSLILNPLHADYLEFVPYRIYESVERKVRILTEWLSGDVAWDLQVCTLNDLLSLLFFTQKRKESLTKRRNNTRNNSFI